MNQAHFFALGFFGVIVVVIAVAALKES